MLQIIFSEGLFLELLLLLNVEFIELCLEILNIIC